jgi:hypothetical protein
MYLSDVPSPGGTTGRTVRWHVPHLGASTEPRQPGSWVYPITVIPLARLSTMGLHAAPEAPPMSYEPCHTQGQGHGKRVSLLLPDGRVQEAPTEAYTSRGSVSKRHLPDGSDHGQVLTHILNPHPSSASSYHILRQSLPHPPPIPTTSSDILRQSNQ